MCRRESHGSGNQAAGNKLTPLWAIVVWAAFAPAIEARPSEPKPFAVEDYFRLQRFAELALSGDGTSLVFITEMRSLETNSVKRSVYLLDVQDDSRVPKQPAELQDGHAFAWTAHGEVAFMSPRSGRDQVYAYDPRLSRVRALTNVESPIIQFKPAPTGSAIAYITQQESSTPSLYNQLREGNTGIAIDPNFSSIIDFTNTWTYGQDQQPRHLWLRKNSGQVEEIEAPGAAQDVFWSSDANYISIPYVSKRMPASMFRDYRTSIGVFAVPTSKFTVLVEAVPSDDGVIGRSYAGGEWVPGTYDVTIRRMVETHTWLRDWIFPDLAMVSALNPWRESKYRWRPIEVYLRDTELIPVDESSVLIATRFRGVNSLLESTQSGVRKSERIADDKASHSLIRFSSDLRTAVFVKDSLSEPPEIYANINGRSFRLTGFNDPLLHKQLPEAAEVHWKSTDGTTVNGWLLVPPCRDKRTRMPLLTYVHGGPAAAFPNAFASFFDAWPYPFEVLAMEGIAVFLPNYRGSSSYGWNIALPTKIDGEPIEDIVSGITYLVDTGLADGSRLGIAGHSHGGWLGPMVATRYRKFRVGSFAEGWSNQIAMYDLFDIQLNREVHEFGFGERSLYESPERYLELSPDLHVTGLNTALLFEAGSEMPILMLGMAKAAKRAGTATSFVVYPRTGHTITIPKLQLESSQRNLAWFRQWLLNDPGNGKETLPADNMQPNTNRFRCKSSPWPKMAH